MSQHAFDRARQARLETEVPMPRPDPVRAVGRALLGAFTPAGQTDEHLAELLDQIEARTSDNGGGRDVRQRRARDPR